MVASILAWTALAAAQVATPPPPAPKTLAQIRGAQWINTRPLTATELRGHAVVLEFWTFGCINCVRTIPAMQELHRQVAKDGVIVIGVHTPEFAYEREPRNVAEAVKARGIAYPVVLDNDRAIWRAFGVQAWPTILLLDTNGDVRYRHVGELHKGTARWNTFVQEIRAATRGTSSIQTPTPQSLAFCRNPAPPRRL